MRKILKSLSAIVLMIASMSVSALQVDPVLRVAENCDGPFMIYMTDGTYTVKGHPVIISEKFLNEHPEVKEIYDRVMAFTNGYAEVYDFCNVGEEM